MEKAMSRDAGPPALRAFPEATKRPVPINGVRYTSKAEDAGAQTYRAPDGNHLKVPPLELPCQSRVRRLEGGLAQVVVVGAAVEALVAEVLAEVVVRKEGLVGVALEAVDEAVHARADRLVVVGLTHAVAAAVVQRVLLELEVAHRVELDVAVGGHGRGWAGEAGGTRVPGSRLGGGPLG
jgi:hypothetical protein